MDASLPKTPANAHAVASAVTGRHGSHRSATSVAPETTGETGFPPYAPFLRLLTRSPRCGSGGAEPAYAGKDRQHRTDRAARWQQRVQDEPR
jgi:hypothetical protein